MISSSKEISFMYAIREARYVQEVMLTEVILEMVIGGLGIAALPRWAAGPQLASGALMGVPLQPPGYRWQWSIAQLRANRQPAYVEEFIRLLADRPLHMGPTPRATRPRRFTSPGRADCYAAATSSLR
jgi:DNA-binding transcriptional LysR family regulator